MTTSVTARQPCSRRWTSSPDRSSPATTAATAAPSSSVSSRRSTPPPPTDLELDLVLDNYTTHKTPTVKARLLKHPRIVLHFTPTSASWLNHVEHWLAELTRRQLQRSTHHCVVELERDIATWTQNWNKNPKPSSGLKQQTDPQNPHRITHLTNYIARSLLEAGGFRPHLHPDWDEPEKPNYFNE